MNSKHYINLTIISFLLFFLVSCNMKGINNYALVDTETLNLRDSSDGNSNILEKLPKNTKLLLLKVDSLSGWTRVEYKGKTGFVKSQFLKTLKTKTKWDIFSEKFIIAFLFCSLGLYGIKTKIVDGRYSGGKRDGARKFNLLTILILSLFGALAWAFLGIFSNT